MSKFQVSVEFTQPVEVEAHSMDVDDKTRVLGFFDEEEELIHVFNSWIYVVRIEE